MRLRFQFLLLLNAIRCLTTGSTFKLHYRYPNKLMMALGVFAAVNILTLTLIFLHLKRSNSVRLFGIYLIAFVFLLEIANGDDYDLIRYALEHEYYPFKFFFQIFSLLVPVLLGIIHLIKGGRLFPISKNKLVLAGILFLALYLFAEAPLHGIHGDLGGNQHGHSYWSGGHLH